ncbi:MAG: hypothetical protein ACRDIE_18315, partial [Chloroflexota bacterium]
MSEKALDLTAVLTLLGKVLGAELQAGCKNRAVSGGISAFFQGRLAQCTLSAEEHDRARRVADYVRRYEAAAVEERPEIARVLIRRLDATLAQAATAPATPPPDPGEPGDRGRGASSAQALPGRQSVPPASPGDAPEVDGGPPEPVPAGILQMRPSRRPRPELRESPPTREQDEDAESPASPSSAQLPESAPAAAAPLAASLDIAAAEALSSPARERQRLEQLGITSLRSAIQYWPREHYDYSAPVRINRMYPDLQVT